MICFYYINIKRTNSKEKADDTIIKVINRLNNDFSLFFNTSIIFAIVNIIIDKIAIRILNIKNKSESTILS